MRHSALARISGFCAAMLPATLLMAAEGPQPAEIAPVQAPSQAQEAPRPASPSALAYGVDDVLKMTRAQISEDVIATYIQTSGAVYNLKPADVVELHQQGVS